MTKFISELSNYVGIKNNLNDNNCFINVCIQTIHHFKDLRHFLLDDEKFKIFENSPKIINELISILSSYNIVSKDNTKKQIIDPHNFRMALADYFEQKGEYQLYKKGDPIELLYLLFIFIHSYLLTNYNQIELYDKICNPICDIHKLFFINIYEKTSCNKCNIHRNQKYDSNYFIHLINIFNVLDIVNKNNLQFYDFYGKLIHCSKINDDQECYQCKDNSLKKEFICESLGKYIIINLIWENKIISLEKLFIICCMITNHFIPEDLFSNNIKGINYKFLGMILLYTNHYVSIFYEKKKGYILYDDTNLKYFQTWKEIIKEIITNRFIPICLFYENNIKNFSKWNLEEKFYNKILSYCKKKDKEKKIENIVTIKDGEWICDQCNQINPPFQINCLKCNFKNSIIELLVQQELRNQMNNNINNFDNKNSEINIKNSINNNIENNESNNNNNDSWICLFCQTKNENREKCKICGRRNNKKKTNPYDKINSKSNNFWTCTSCNYNFNLKNNPYCNQCKNKKK